MNIKIVNSWLREYLETQATNKDIARELSLTSVSVERTEKIGEDYVYDIEVTTNRPDLMSVMGIAEEAAAILPEQGIPAKLKYLKTKTPSLANISFPIEIVNDPRLVNRICAVVMDVEIGKSPKIISDRLEKSGIRSLNNLIDVTNYVMREIGHPCHVFDFDLLNTKKMIIRESKPGEIITTLDGKEYRLYGGDIVADDGTGNIIDLLGVMGTQNSVVQENTKRILFFIDNNNPLKIRKTSMSLGIRTEAAIINEKGVDPELAMTALRRGVELYQEIAKGKVISKVIDLYPNKPKSTTIKVPLEKINNVIGITIEPAMSVEILKKLGFNVKEISNNLEVKTPTLRPDVKIDEDVIEEIARVYGYHKLPSIVPTYQNSKNVPYANNFYFEDRAKNALKYWGFDETYSYSLVSEDLYYGPIENAIKLKNPLTEDLTYLRNSLVPSLLQIIKENKTREEIKIFEMANIYHKRAKSLPKETLTLGGAVRKQNVSFFEIKGIIEQLLEDLGIKNFKFHQRIESIGADVSIGNDEAGYIEVLNNNLIDFELNFELISKHANLKKTYKPMTKFPPVIEDLTLVLDQQITTQEVIEEMQIQNSLIAEITLKGIFENSRTFHIIYQAHDRNLNNQEISQIRDKIINAVKEKFKALVK